MPPSLHVGSRTGPASVYALSHTTQGAGQMPNRTAKNLIDTPCHVLRADWSAAAIMRQLYAEDYGDESLIVLVDNADVVGKISVGRLKAYIVEFPDLSGELAGNLADTSYAICRTTDCEAELNALAAACDPDVILVSDAGGRICGAIRELPR